MITNLIVAATLFFSTADNIVVPDKYYEQPVEMQYVDGQPSREATIELCKEIAVQTNVKFAKANTNPNRKFFAECRIKGAHGLTAPVEDTATRIE